MFLNAEVLQSAGFSCPVCLYLSLLRLCCWVPKLWSCCAQTPSVLVPSALLFPLQYKSRYCPLFDSVSSLSGVNQILIFYPKTLPLTVSSISVNISTECPASQVKNLTLMLAFSAPHFQSASRSRIYLSESAEVQLSLQLCMLPTPHLT